MRLNTIKPAEGATKNAKRVGRGIGCGSGKTCGRGHKGQNSRSGGGVMRGFEGGQMPLQRRLPKFGFTSLTAQKREEIRLHELGKIDAEIIDLKALRAKGLIKGTTLQAKIIDSGKIEKAVKIQGIKVTAGAKKAIETAGGSVE